MTEHPLDGFTAHDSHDGGSRAVTFGNDVLTVEVRDGYGGSEAAHYRLVQVQQGWHDVNEEKL